MLFLWFLLFQSNNTSKGIYFEYKDISFSKLNSSKTKQGNWVLYRDLGQGKEALFATNVEGLKNPISFFSWIASLSYDPISGNIAILGQHRLLNDKEQSLFVLNQRDELYLLGRIGKDWDHYQKNDRKYLPYSFLKQASQHASSIKILFDRTVKPESKVAKENFREEVAALKSLKKGTRHNLVWLNSGSQIKWIGWEYSILFDLSSQTMEISPSYDFEDPPSFLERLQEEFQTKKKFELEAYLSNSPSLRLDANQVVLEGNRLFSTGDPYLVAGNNLYWVDRKTIYWLDKDLKTHSFESKYFVHDLGYDGLGLYLLQHEKRNPKTGNFLLTLWNHQKQTLKGGARYFFPHEHGLYIARTGSIDDARQGQITPLMASSCPQLYYVVENRLIYNTLENIYLNKKTGALFPPIGITFTFPIK